MEQSTVDMKRLIMEHRVQAVYLKTGKGKILYRLYISDEIEDGNIKSTGCMSEETEKENIECMRLCI